jgi:hypothetical protein
MTMSRLFPAVLASVWAGLISTQAAGQWAATKIVPQPTHKCDDPVPGGDVMKTIQIADQKDSSAHANGRDGNWYVTRSTKWIPYCMYHDPIGLYSLDTYSLTPKIIEEEVQICEALAGGGSRPVAPFAGPCPPLH